MVRTEMSVATAEPGGTLEGVIEIIGGQSRADVGYAALALVANSTWEFHRCEVVPGFTLGPGDKRVFPFVCEVPREAPLTFPGVQIGLRTELEIARAVDRTDVDPVEIIPSPAQRHILDCLRSMGFELVDANLERGRLRGVPHTLPFYQEIKFLPAGTGYARRLRQLEVTFVATQDRLHVVIELDRRVTPLSDRDVFGHFAVNPAKLHDIDWRALLDNWLAGLT